jgi:hypothetical protein
VKPKKGKGVPATISLDIATRTLVCLDFLSPLPEITLWTNVRLPIRVGDKIVLSPVGYDPASGVYTSPDAPPVNEQMTIEQATDLWRTLLSEFCFPNGDERERAISVTLAAALTAFCFNLLHEQAKRPAFAVTANSEGAGKTLLLSIGMVALLGYVPIGSAPKDEDEMRKVLDAAAHNAVPIVFFDNLKGHLNSGELEAFITSARRRYRLLGTTNYTEAPNVSTVYITANFATYSPDLRRRLLPIELILEQARAEERVIKNNLDDDMLVQKRSELLAICWTLIRHWYENGEPTGSKKLPSFENWSEVVPGIIETAGFASPCQLASLQTGGDIETQDMEKLVAEMVVGSEYRFGELVDLAREQGLFPKLIPDQGELERWQSTKLGFIFKKFVGRIFNVPEPDDTGKTVASHFRFCLSGETQKTRRYFIEAA